MCKSVISQQRSLPQGVFFCVCVFAVDRRCRRRPSNNSSQPPPTCPQSQSVGASATLQSHFYVPRRAQVFFSSPPFLSLSPPSLLFIFVESCSFISVQHTSGWLHTTLEDYILFDVITHTQGKVKNDFHTIFFSRLDKGIPNLFLCVWGEILSFLSKTWKNLCARNV